MISAAQMVRLSAALLVVAGAAHGQQAAGDQAALNKALRGKHITLEAGINAAASRGTPISAKFEHENRKFQLSVYVKKGTDLSEVFVDPITGKIRKVEKLADSTDVADATAQDQAMTGATSTLADAVTKAVAANKGYTATGAVPLMKNGRAVVEVSLMKGPTGKKVLQPLM